MKIYRYWTKKTGCLYLHNNETQDTVVYGYSNTSPEDAAKKADQTLKIIQNRVDRSARYRLPENYEAPIREEFLEEIAPGNIITRNYYGAEILNTETIIFADVDDKSVFRRYVPGFFGRLLGKKEETFAEYQNRLRASILNSIKPEWKKQAHIRIYRTHSGYRVLFAGLNVNPGSRDSLKIMNQINSDPLYVRLCGIQNCCRARLTPKPSRIQHKGIHAKFPYAQEDLSRISNWIAEYQQKSENFAVCKLIETYGRRPMETDAKVIAYHDQKCGVGRRLPLA